MNNDFRRSHFDDIACRNGTLLKEELAWKQSFNVPGVCRLLQQKKLKNPVVVAPNAGGAKRAKKFADMIGAELAMMHKTRTGHHQAQIIEVVGNIKGRTCIVFDDIIDTGSTLVPARQALIKRKANPEIYAVATHAVFSGKAIDNLRAAKFAEVVVTDSLPVKNGAFLGLKVLTIATLLAKVISNIQSGQSVTEIYK